MTTSATTAAPPPALSDYPLEPRRDVPTGGYRGRDAGTRDAPLVSAITAVRNGAATIARTAASVRSQEGPRIEHIVVDGASTDGTVEVLRSLDRDIALWTSEPDRGISDAFNKGIALAHGEIIGILNSDDWYEPGAVAAVVHAMEESGAEIVCGSLQYWEGGRKTYLASSDPGLLSRAMHIGHPTVFVRRATYRRLGLFRLDFKLAMDYEWLLRAKTAGASFLSLDRCIANKQAGGVGDRRWRDGQREVARARAMHIAAADSALAYHAYVASQITKGIVRRGLDALGLGAIRRMYHRWLSPVKVVPSGRARRGDRLD